MKMLLIFFSSLMPCMSYYKDQKPVFRAPFHGYRQAIDSLYYQTRPTVFRQSLRQSPNNPNLAQTLFPPIVNRQVNANKMNEDKYLWIANVIHSREKYEPHICTAACIDTRIFMTAARCLEQATVEFLTVRYQEKDLRAIAIVLPSKPTKQRFDDIGFIIVDRGFSKTWKEVKVYEAAGWKRTDNNFRWLKPMEATAIGFVLEPNKPYLQYLYEVPVYIQTELCYSLYNNDNAKADSYFVPCYHTCTIDEAAKNDPNCIKYLAGEGHIVIERPIKGSEQVLGVATWAGYYNGEESMTMPVGMAIPNTDTFSKDLKCAKKIKDAPETTKSFVGLCKK